MTLLVVLLLGLASDGVEVATYTPPPEVTPRHVVHVYKQKGAFFYVTDGIATAAQPGGSARDKNLYVELATYAERSDLRIAEMLSLFGEAMIAHPARGPFNAWNYDTLSLPAPVHGLRTFVLRPGGEMKRAQGVVSIFTVIPVSEDERPHVVNVGAERARAWVEAHVRDTRAALARWKLRD